MLTHLWPAYSSANRPERDRYLKGGRGSQREREEALQRVEPCCQGRIDFGRSNRLVSMECGPGESSAAGSKKCAFIN